MTESSAMKPVWKKLLAPWALVITGILFNILSAVITNYFISVNNSQLSQLEERSQRIDSQINNYWQDRQNIERKLEFILLLQQQGKQTNDPFVRQYIENFIANILKRYKIPSSEQKKLDSQQIINIVKKTQEQIVNDIDEVYFDKLTLEKEKTVIASINSRLMSIALFLQLLGLILVLAKDFQRNG